MNSCCLSSHPYLVLFPTIEHTTVLRFMPGMLEAGLIIGGVTSGPIIGVFTLGMVVPWVSEKGALGGFIISVAISSWIAAGKTIYGGQLKYVSVTSPKVQNIIISYDFCIYLEY